MILFPNAKINLGLHILSKREDNFHNLETLMYPIGLSDILEFLPTKAGESSLQVSGITISGDAKENLVYKAYVLLKEKYNLPEIQIHLHKQIPAGAGLGGGSSDAAFMLKGLNTFFKLNLSIDDLKEYASKLGSDCSFFIENKAAIATGRGEILENNDISLEKYKIRLYFPDFQVSTKEAYSGVIPDSKRNSLNNVLRSGIGNWEKSLQNDFEKTIFLKYSELAELKAKLYQNGAIYSSMSGSGSAVFGIFEKNAKLSEELKKYLVWEG